MQKCTEMRSNFQRQSNMVYKGAKSGIMVDAGGRQKKSSNQKAINRCNSWVAQEVKGCEAGSSLHRGLVSGLWGVLEYTNKHKLEYF